MIPISCVKTQKHDIVKPLCKFISPKLAPTNRDGVIRDLKKIGAFREVFRNDTQYLDENSIQHAKQYLDGLLSIVESFPVMAESACDLITWYSAVNSRMKLSTKNFLVEVMCTLFNIAALYSQKALSHLPVELTIPVIDEACSNLAIANGYLAVISRELAHMCGNDAKLPEIHPTAIEGYRNLLSAHLHFLKGRKAMFLHPDKRRLFVTVFMGSRQRYEEALRHFRASPYPMPESFIAVVEAMSKAAFTIALYYEGYLTPEEMENYTVHGSGKGYYCMTTCEAMMKEISQSTVPAVTQKVAPLLAFLSEEVVDSIKGVMEKWMLQRSFVPRDTSSFNMKASFLNDTTKPELHPSIDFSVILSEAERKQYQTVCAQYAQFCSPLLADVDRCVEGMKKNIEEYLYARQYYPIVSAASQKEGVADYYDTLLNTLYKMEREHPLDVMICGYHAKRAELTEAMASCDNDYSNVIRSVGMNPAKYTAQEVAYLKNTMFKSIEQNKNCVTAMDAREKKMKEWLDVKDGKYFVYIQQHASKKVREWLAKPTNAEEEEDRVNDAVNTKADLDGLCKKVTELKDAVHCMAERHFMLTAEFFTNERGRDDLQSSFPKFSMDCQNAASTCQKQAGVWKHLMDKLQKILNDIKCHMEHNKAYTDKCNVMVILSIGNEAYMKLQRYAEFTQECEKTIQAFRQCSDYINRFARWSVCLKGLRVFVATHPKRLQCGLKTS